MKKFAVALLMLGTLGGLGCFGASDQEIAQANAFFASTFYFASTRLIPNNSGGDGDIFFGSVSNPGVLVNLTDAGSNAGDDDDHLCLWDVQRFRVFFMSRRTDVGNVGGDLDIFTVPAVGGTITNLTDEKSGSAGDDFCNAIHQPTGNLLFTSIRNFNGSDDPDIYYLQVIPGDNGATAGELKNLTELAGDVGTDSRYEDHFETLVGDQVVFSSRRRETDKNGVQNCNADAHLFSVGVNDAAGDFVNLSQQGNQSGCTGLVPPTFDFFCDVIVGQDPSSGQPMLKKVFFFSDQAVGDNGGQQFTQDYDIFSVDPLHPNVLRNLTDAFTGDGDDKNCRIIDRSHNGNDWVAFFDSNRQAIGTRTSAGDWSDLVNPERDVDIYMTTLPDTGTGNEIVSISDGANANDQQDDLMAVCGNTVIFSSERTDITSNGGNIDLYAVGVSAAGVTSILPLSKSSASASSQPNCFLSCDVTNSSVIFVSDRTDAGNAHGPANDTDLFRSRFNFNPSTLELSQVGSIENLTDAETGDGYDFLQNIFASGSSCDFNLSVKLESNVATFDSSNSRTGGIFHGFPIIDPREFVEDDFGFAINMNNAMLFTSDRSDPVNVNGDVDIFVQNLPQTPGAETLRAIVNLTDGVSGEDDNDGIEGYIGPVGATSR